MTPLTCAEIEDSLLERASTAEPQLTPEGAQHVAGCLRCSELVAGLKRVREALSPTTVEPPASLGARLLSHVRGDGRFGDLAPEAETSVRETLELAERILRRRRLLTE